MKIKSIRARQQEYKHLPIDTHEPLPNPEDRLIVDGNVWTVVDESEWERAWADEIRDGF